MSILLRARDVRASLATWTALGRLSAASPLGPFLTVDPRGALRGAPGGEPVGAIDGCGVDAEASWMPVFGVGDVAHAAARVVRAGGGLVGRTGDYFCVCVDPWGVEFGFRASRLGGMGGAQHPAPGELAWLERSVGEDAHVAAAAAFYSTALGWTGGVVPGGDAEAPPYAVMRAGGRRVAGITTTSEIECAEPCVPQWLPYFETGTEAALDLVAARADELRVVRRLCPPTPTADGVFALLTDYENGLRFGLLCRVPRAADE